jgi:hypothetical protein
MRPNKKMNRCDNALWAILTIGFLTKWRESLELVAAFAEKRKKARKK